jgi:hypothetical protein
MFVCLGGVAVGVGNWLGQPEQCSPRDSKVFILIEKFLFSALIKF